LWIWIPDPDSGSKIEKREHTALQKIKILSFFLFFGAILDLLDPDPDPKFVCGSGYRSSSPN
jgi:hypothetical protein